MKSKLFAIALALVVGLSLCVPAFAFVVEEEPSSEKWLLPEKIFFTDDEDNLVLAMSSSSELQTDLSETYYYGNGGTYYTTAYTNGFETYYDFMYETGDLRNCSEVQIIFPAFYFTDVIGPPASNPTVSLPYASDYVTVDWFAFVTYYDANGVKYTDRQYIPFGDTLNTTFDIPVNELRALYSSYDYVNVESLQCNITVSDASASCVSVTRQQGLNIDIGYLLPDNLTIEVTEITPNLFDWIITPLDSFLNIQIVPPDPSGDFGGATIGGVLALVVAIPLLVAFLKVFAGG